MIGKATVYETLDSVVRHRVNDLVRDGKTSVTKLAARAGLPRMTVWRFLEARNDEPTARVVEMVARAAGLRIKVSPPSTSEA